MVFNEIPKDERSKVAAHVLKTNQDCFYEMCTNGLIGENQCASFPVSKNVMEYIFDNNIIDCYYLLVSKENESTFLDFISETSDRLDFAKLIFNPDGSTKYESSALSISLVCIKEIETNIGCFTKAVNGLPEEKLKDTCWVKAMEELVKKKGGFDKSNKLSLPNFKEYNDIINVFIRSGLVTLVKGPSNKKIYFALQK